jgi:hypothetical protein
MVESEQTVLHEAHMMHFMSVVSIGTPEGMMLSHMTLQLAVQSQFEWHSRR